MTQLLQAQWKMTFSAFFPCTIVSRPAVTTDIVEIAYLILGEHRLLPFSGFFGIVINELIAHFTLNTSSRIISVNRSAVSAKFHFE